MLYSKHQEQDTFKLILMGGNDLLVTMKEILDRAKKENYAVLAANFLCEVDARAFLEAAEDLNAPLILDMSYKNSMGIVFTGRYIAELCNMAKIPVALNLDHGRDMTHFASAVRAGFTSMMIDCSALPFEENVETVKQVVSMAHSIGMSAEAELGHVGKGAEYDTIGKSFTDPEEAAEYVERTNVDCLAVAVGTAHGAYKGTPFIDFDRLEEIHKRVSVPLVIHGGSGTGKENLYKVARSGVNKININNDLICGAYEQLMRSDMHGNGAYSMWNYIKNGFRDRAKEYIQLFGSDGKAWMPDVKGLEHRQLSLVE